MPTSTQIYDSADFTLFLDTSDTNDVTIRAVSKPGAIGANYAALVNGASGALSTLTTARALLQAGGAAWDNATPAQRSALMLTLVNVASGLIRLHLGILDKSS
jgi:hypothetical protein